MKKSLVVLLCLTISLAGCGSKYGKQETVVHHYPDCYAPIAELRKSETKTRDGAVAGAFMGALVGAIAGLAISGKADGALVGATAGAVLGGATGYIKGKQDQYEDDRQRYASYINDMDTDMQGATSVQLAANHARKCYEERFDEAAREFKVGLISRAEFQSRYTEIKSGLVETSRILEKAVASLDEKQRQYYDVLQQEAEKASRPVPKPRPVATAPTKPATPAPKPAPKPTQPTGTATSPQSGSTASTANTPATASPTLQGLSDKNAEIAQTRDDTVHSKETIDETIAMMDRNADVLLGIDA